jgi:hypothetical protein
MEIISFSIIGTLRVAQVDCFHQSNSSGSLAKIQLDMRRMSLILYSVHCGIWLQDLADFCLLVYCFEVRRKAFFAEQQFCYNFLLPSKSELKLLPSTIASGGIKRSPQTVTRSILMSDTSRISPPVQSLLNRGVIIPSPYSVEVDESVNAERIAPGVVIRAGCRIAGAKTSIGPGSELGREAPAAIEDCQLGHNVQLKGGYFSEAVFLDGANMGSAAHVRSGTIIEEQAGGAHTVGFKQTIFLSFVTAGSLINFCDVLMAGGTSRNNHSEIGTSYIHFNFTPHQDKATPSLIGDVTRGVFLDQPPIFLGGQGGLVGPVRIAYGTVIPAGTLCRQDILEGRRLYTAPASLKESRAFAIGIYRSINRIVENNLIYIGNLWALKAWYQYARIRTMSSDDFNKACHAGAIAQIEDGLKERMKRLKELADKMPVSIKRAAAETGEDLPAALKAQQQALADKSQEIEARLKAGPPATIGNANRDAFLKEWEQTDASSGHLEAVKALSSYAKKAGTAWLQEIVNSASALWIKI